MKSLLHIAICFLFFSPISSAQVVWPGDVNNNGIVNEIDLLYLGFAFGETGSPRATENSEWIGQEITTIWENTFPDGLNFAYADCNGDGKVNEEDAVIIETNLTETHDDVPFIVDNILEAIPGQDPKFAFLTENLTVTQNVRFDLNIGLGNDDIQVKNALGFAFTISVNPKIFQTNRTTFDFNGLAWIDPSGGNNTSLILADEEKGTITVAITRTDKKPASGAGFIGTVSFVIETNAIDFLVKEDTLKVAIDSVTLITDDLEKIPVEGTSVILELEGRTTSAYDPILDEIKFYPNPTTGWILLKTNKILLDKVELVNTLGQVIYEKKLSQNQFQSLDFQQVPKGLYWLRMISKYGIKSTPIQKL